MENKIPIILFLICLLVIGGCESKTEKSMEPQVDESQQSKKETKEDQVNELPAFSKKSDFGGINWNKEVIKIGTNGPSDIIGNQNKVGFIVGPKLQSEKLLKWQWHFWGISEGTLTVVGYHENSLSKHPVLNGSWSYNYDTISGSVTGEKINGADSILNSNVLIPKQGKWALLVYINENLFDTLVLNIQ